MKGGIKRFGEASMYARGRLQTELAQRLLDFGVVRNLKDGRQMTAFDYAKRYGELSLCRLFDPAYGATPAPRSQTPSHTHDASRPMTPADSLYDRGGGYRPETPAISEMS